MVTLSKSKPYPESRATLDGLLGSVQSTNFLWETNQFQPNLLHDIVNDTVAPSGVENEAYHGNNNVHRMNNVVDGQISKNIG